MEDKNYFLNTEGFSRTEILGLSPDIVDFALSGEQGVIFHNNILDVVQAYLLEKGFVLKQTSPTSYEGLFNLVLQRWNGTDRVLERDMTGEITLTDIALEDSPAVPPEPEKIEFVHRWNGDFSEERFKNLVLKVFAPSCKKLIKVHTPHSSFIQITRPKFPSEFFHIILWGRLYDSVVAPVYNGMKIFGASKFCKDGMMMPTGKGKNIIDINTGTVPAEIYRNCLLIHFDSVHYGHEDETIILTEILTRAAILIKETKKEQQAREEKEKELLKNILLVKKDENVKYMLNMFVGKAEKLKAESDRKRQEADNLQSQLATRLFDLQTLSSQIEALTSKSEILQKRMESEYLKICKLPQIERIDFSNDGIMSIHTLPLLCEDPRTNIIHEIGRFLITFHISGMNFGKIVWKNKDRVIKGYDGKPMQAPHVFREGNACQGNQQEVFAQLFASMEFFILVSTAINFIETVNVADSAGKHISNWPVAKKPETKEDADGCVEEQEEEEETAPATAEATF